MVLDEEDLGWEDVADDCETLGDPTSQQGKTNTYSLT